MESRSKIRLIAGLVCAAGLLSALPAGAAPAIPDASSGTQVTLAGYYGGYYSRRYYRDDDDEDYGWRRYRHAGARWLFNDEYEGSSYRDYGHSCRYWRHRCAESWGWGNSDYYGCTRYHGCD